jgi:hypothetical protein
MFLIPAKFIFSPLFYPTYHLKKYFISHIFHHPLSDTGSITVFLHLLEYVREISFVILFSTVFRLGEEGI